MLSINLHYSDAEVCPKCLMDELSIRINILLPLGHLLANKDLSLSVPPLTEGLVLSGLFFTIVCFYFYQNLMRLQGADGRAISEKAA